MTARRLLALAVSHCVFRPRLALLAALVLAALCAWAGAERLGISTDTGALFSDSLPWRQRQVALDQGFPQFSNLLVAVVDAAAPEQADATAEALAQVLAKDTRHLTSVRRPDASPYFARNGLLFLDPKALGGLLDHIIDAQPFLGQLSADPSARGLFAALNLLAMGAERGEGNLAAFAPSIAAFHTSLAAAAAGQAVPLSWQTLLAGDLAAQAGPFRFVVTQPVLD